MMSSSEGAQATAGTDGFDAVRRAQVGLGAASLGALLVLFPFGRTLGFVGIALIAAGTVLSTSFERRSHVWWGLLVAGAALSLFAPLVAIAAETLAGFMAIIGGTLILVAAALALPVHGDAP